MKVAITARKENLDAEISTIFNAADYFLIFDSDDIMNYKVIKNPHINLFNGSEIFGAQLVVGQDVNVLITGNCTPNASRIFQAAGIKVIENAAGTVKDGIDVLTKQSSFPKIKAPEIKQ